MPLLEELQTKIAQGAFEFSRHALDQSLRRHINVQEIGEAFDNADIIEDYPKDKYGPSCLALGFTTAGRALHIQCSHPTRPLVKIITLYEPDPALWDNLRTRKP